MLGIALGVAVVVAVDLANASATRAFELSVESLNGRTTHRLHGGASRVPNAVWTDLRTGRGVFAGTPIRAAAPVVEGVARIVHDGRRTATVTVLGVDPFAEAPLRPWLAAFDRDGLGVDVARLLREPGTVLATTDTLRSLRIAVGDELRIEAAGRAQVLRVLGALTPGDALVQRGLDLVLVADLATAQEALHRHEGLDRIDLVLDAATAESLARRLAAPLRLEAAERTRGVLHELTRAFRTNLQALALLSLLVGAFLVHGTVAFTVVRRRRTLGILRAIGATPRQVFGAILRDAAALGALGILLGLGLGVLLAEALLGLVAQTIADLYFTTNVRAVAFDPTALVKAALVGIGACVLAALGPAREAAGVGAREVIARIGLEVHVRRARTRRSAVAVFALAAGIALVMLTQRDLVAAYLGILAILLGCALLAAPLTELILAALAPVVAQLGIAATHALRGARASTSRTSIAITALVLAVAATVGLAAMIHSFRGTVATWLGTTLSADVWITVPSSMAERTQVTLDAETVAALRALPGVRAASTIRRVGTVDGEGRDVELAAIEPGPTTIDGYTFVAGTRDDAARAYANGDELLISEPLAWRLSLTRGDVLVLRTDRGEASFTIAAVFRDYASERGWAALSRAGYEQRFDDRELGSLALWADDTTAVGVLAQRVRERAAALEQSLSISSTAELRDASLRIFDRTFAITDVLRLLCVLVAALGAWSAFGALQLDRLREVAVLRALGATPRQVFVTTCSQSAWLGLCAGLLAIPTGTVLAVLLTEVVNRRSFGWTLLALEVPLATMAGALLLSVGAAILAGLLPAWQLSRRPIQEALRDE